MIGGALVSEELPSVEECIDEIRTKPVVPIWPTVGVVFGLSKGGAYDSARRGILKQCGSANS